MVGYYALAMSSVAHAGAPSRPRRGMPDPVAVVVRTRLALDRTELNVPRGLIILAVFLVPLIVLGALGEDQYWLSVTFGALFVGLAYPPGAPMDTAPRG